MFSSFATPRVSWTIVIAPSWSVWTLATQPLIHRDVLGISRLHKSCSPEVYFHVVHFILLCLLFLWFSIFPFFIWSHIYTIMFYEYLFSAYGLAFHYLILFFIDRNYFSLVWLLSLFLYGLCPACFLWRLFYSEITQSSIFSSNYKNFTLK